MTSSEPGSTGEDPTLESALKPLKQLLDGLNDEIARLYAREGVTGVRPRFTMALIRLHHRGPMSVKALAAEIDVTHSAMSQTVTALRGEGLVETAPGPDARTRLVSLTGQGRDLVPFLEAEWRATERAFAGLQAELSQPLQRWIDDMETALRRRAFLDRITDELDHPGPDSPRPDLSGPDRPGQ
ncbi:MarR family winged helix-turn-helix transcriptional regulator [Pseudonocardia sp. KRD291]|uniref:MarR family winged helix-turn-helix transcriptional regulator n=1 Tax=Pseudonocardia sp. KRD291 TaxID=2792007 RepID=UPI001C4A2E3D|nr:MarR family transcriptional regulator [Pseudonocardia sp. KRD291]MBW0106625.1 MarR family transcriptional regulator [Pseudonocardia sp. KRD291]